MRRTRLLVLLGLLAVAGPAGAQPAPEAEVEAVWQAFQQLEYDTAEQQALEALARRDAFTDAEVARLFEVLALITYSRNQPGEARRYFEAALDLNPDLDLDPLLVSPKITEFFDEVKQAWQATAQTRPAPEIIYVEDPRTAAALRSLVVPGWGQLYKGERTKGRLLAGLFATTTAGALAAHLRADDRAGDALDAPADLGPADLGPAAAGEDGRGWRRTRDGLAAASAALWLFSYLDALTTGAETPPAPRLALVPAQPAPRLVLRLRF